MTAFDDDNRLGAPSKAPSPFGKAPDARARADSPSSKQTRAPAPAPGNELAKVPDIPAPTLPKGGGALHGIGEKFQMAAFTGTGGLSVPIAISPGRSGMGPSVSLSYNSGAGSGPFGIGWSLSVPSIRRRTEKGLPQYFDKGETDVFLLSGAEDLVPVLVLSGSDWVRLTVSDRNGEHIERFRPRIEGVFARIERHTVIATGNVYWVSVTKDNVTSIYGRNTQARIADPNNANKIFEWLLEATYDDRGNVVYYEYKAEDLGNVTPVGYELHRTSSSVSAQRYPKRIYYGNTTPRLGPDLTDTDIQSNTWLFEVVFDYGEHDATTPTPTEVNTWAARQDPFSTYKPGFEVRTYRLCQRVLMFHTFSELGTTDPVLVRSTDFTYSPNPNVTYLTEVTQKGYILSSGTYSSASLPPVDFTYQTPSIDSTVKLADSATRKAMPGTIDGRSTRWVDLDGEGIAGLLSDEPGGSLTYRRNLGGAALSPPMTLVKRPSTTALAQGRQQLLDLESEGHLELVDFSGVAKGYYDRTEDRAWGNFVPFRALPVLDWNDPNIQFLDINGDGFADILRTEGNRIVWYPSQGKAGFGAGIIIPVSPNERKGACVVFDDGEQCVHVADMSGDGLSDIVRVRNGEVSYWPNLGYGKFGGKVSMTKAPWFDNPDLFDPRRVRLFDVDGSGTTDIGYVGRKGVALWLNQAGNSFSDAIALLEYIPTHDLASITFADFLGTGTACLVWFSTAPSDQASRLRYVDLYASVKPHLLKSTDNNMGLTTTLTYATSTKFYLQDKAAGIEWATRLSFPVHVVEKVEVYEAVTKQRFISTYSYRHGYYDGPEREFRGFGYVEQSDAESYSDDVGSGTFPSSPPTLPDVDGEFQIPPVVTKTWFHTGAWKDGADIAAAFVREYFSGDSSATVLPRTVMTDFTPGTPQEAREAARALKGSILRQEIYAEDGSSLADKPFSVSERSYAVKQLQPQVGGTSPTRYGVYLAHAREVIDYHYERDATDPRVQHAFTLAVDDFGVVTQAAAVGYPRRGSPTYTEQTKMWVTLAEKDVIHVDNQDTWYRIGVPQESRSFELTGITAPSGGAVLAFSDVATAASSATQISYETAPTSGYQKRLLKQAQAYYYSDDLSSILSLGTIESKALIHHTRSLALTGGLVSAVYDTSIVTSTLLTTECGFLSVGSDYWAVSSVPTYDDSHFYLVTTVTEPFGNESSVVFDSYYLLPSEAHTSQTTTPIDYDLVTTFDNDYRVLGPQQTTDPNGNRVAVAFDELGMVIKMAEMGKSGGSDGDTLSDPTAYFEYDLTSWATTEGTSTPTPNYAHAYHRKEHGGTASWQESVSYTAGNGKEVLRKVQAAPDPITSDPRWIGNGRTVWDNKGNPIKQYEPYFAADSGYDLESDLASSGVTPIMRYDALSRLIRTDFPNGTFSTVVFDPWHQETWDPNDNTLASVWYDTNYTHGTSGTPLYRAATLAAAHDGTPTLAHADSLGRTFLTEQDNGTSSSHTYYDTRLSLDVEGNTLSVTDARGNTTLSHTYCPTGAAVQSVSAEAGASQALYSTSGEALRSWNSRSVAVRHVFDVLRRVTQLWVKIGAGTEFLAELTVYGEWATTPTDYNLLGRVYAVYDGAGLATNVNFDFKGNLLSSSRTLAKTYSSTPDWSAAGSDTNLGDIQTHTSADLESEVFTTSKTYDALDRVTSITTPDTSVYTPTYNEASQLEAVDVNILGASTATNFVSHIEYNARGQRIEIDYVGTSAAFTTTYTYEAETFRLSRQITTITSSSKKAQDATLTYDPVGNIVEIDDNADEDLYFSGIPPLASAGGLYEYDAIYRLSSSTGREHPGQLPTEALTDLESPLAALPHPNDTSGNALRAYTESFTYDEVGNITEMFHDTGDSNTWTRDYTYESSNNKLDTTSATGTSTYTYTHDERGNMTALLHLSSIGWDWADRMQACDKGGGGNVYFTYDSAGNRVRKVWDKSGSLRDERIYLGNYEIWRESDPSIPKLNEERQTVHVLDDVRRIATIETLTVHSSSPVSPLQPRQRFQISNQLESSVVELTEAGAIISYEEYFAFGMTSFHSANGSFVPTYVSQRCYRYNGKERDEETGLYYYGARYYAAWLGRWLSCDPSGADGPNRYSYVRNCPIRLLDPNGEAGNDSNAAHLQQEAAKYKTYEDFAKATPSVYTNEAMHAAFDAAHRATPAGTTPSDQFSPEALKRAKDAAAKRDLQPAGEPSWGERHPWAARGITLGVGAGFVALTVLSGGSDLLVGGIVLGTLGLAGDVGNKKEESVNSTLQTVGVGIPPLGFALLLGSDLSSDQQARQQALDPSGASSMDVLLLLPFAGGPRGGSEQVRARFLETLRLRQRQVELGTDPVNKRFSLYEGSGGVHIEQALGKQISRHPDAAADFDVPGIGPVSLKGPLLTNEGVPIVNDTTLAGLTKQSIKDVQQNTFTKALFVDLSGLSDVQAAQVKHDITAGTAGATKPVYFLRQ